MLLILGSGTGESKTAARRLLAVGLRELWGLEEIPHMERGPMGKPFFPSAPHIHFNLSHSGDLALCALSDQPVGVDIERVRPHRPGLPEYALSPREYRWFLEQGGGWERFCQLWTRKESWVKRTGGSVAAPTRICPPLPGEEGRGVFLRDFSGAAWRAAVCGAYEGPCPILWEEEREPN